MANITLKGNAIATSGNLPSIGEKAKDFSMIGSDLAPKTLQDFSGHNLILNIFPSVDTGTCAASVRSFNKEAASLENTKVLCISRDLPFAQNRFCGSEGIENVVMLSDFSAGKFGKDYGLEIGNFTF
jgi:thiol peroxidase